MLSEFVDRQAANADLYELEDVETGQKRQYRIVSKATVTVPGTDLNKATLDPILAEIAGKLDNAGGTMTGNFSGPGASGTLNMGYPKQINVIYAIQAYLNSLEMKGDILPDSNNARNVGSAIKRMAYVYGNIGNFKEQVAIDGNAIIDSSYSSSTNKGYVKIYDGTMICYGKQTWTNLSVTNAWGSMFESSLVTFSNFASTFNSAPVVIAFPNPSGSTYFIEGYYNVSASCPGSFYVCLPGSNSNMTAGASYIAIGRWK